MHYFFYVQFKKLKLIKYLTFHNFFIKVEILSVKMQKNAKKYAFFVIFMCKCLKFINCTIINI